MNRIIAFSLALFVAAGAYLATSDGNAASKKTKKLVSPETSTPGIPQSLRDQAASQGNTTAGKTGGCTPWHKSSGAPC